MLVSLALVSVLALALYSSLHICFTAQRSAESAMSPVTAAAAALSIVRADLESALPPTGLLAGEFLGEDETGEAGDPSDILRFHTCSGSADVHYPEETFDPGLMFSLGTLGEQEPAGETRSDVHEVEYVLERDEEGADFNLLRLVTKNLLTTTTQEPPEQIVCRNVTALNIRYLDGSSWVDSWDSGQRENALPPAIEVSLEVRCRKPREETTRGLVTPVDEDEEDRRFTLVVVIGLPAGAPASEEENQFIR
jgi:hypothetical protein